MKKVFLDDLPRKGKFIDWKKSIGHKVSFTYDEIEGEVEILEYCRSYIKVKHKQEVTSVHCGNFIRCRIGKLIGKQTDRHFYSTNDIIDNVTSGKLKILNRIRMNKHRVKGYEYQCLNCGNLDSITEYNLKNMMGCNACCSPPQKVLVGYNDIHTVDPEFGKILWNHSDGFKYTISSGRKIDFKCKNCGFKINKKTISSVYHQGLSCHNCSDGMSYPNKIMYNLLMQMGINFESEYSPKWAVVSDETEIINGRKKYDFYIPSENIIIEMHGEQHYKSTRRKQQSRSLELEKLNDELKEKMAKSNGIKYITIKADVSKLEYIKEKILNSELSRIFSLDHIDWSKCDAVNSLVKEVCDFYKDGNHSIISISKLKNLSRHTVRRYLKRGKNIGMCDYDTTIRVIRMDMEGTYIDEFISITAASKQLGLHPSNIAGACKGRHKTIGGFKWMYKKDYEKYIAQQQLK